MASALTAKPAPVPARGHHLPLGGASTGTGPVRDDRSRKHPGRRPRRHLQLLVLRLGRERELANRIVAEFNIKPSDPERVIEQLSGGNQQKSILARWLRLKPSVLLLQEPTQGVDVAARDEIAAKIWSATGLGAAVLVNSTDMAELARLCHRVVVLREGEVAATLHGDSLTVPNLRHAVHKTKEAS